MKSIYLQPETLLIKVAIENQLLNDSNGVASGSTAESSNPDQSDQLAKQQEWYPISSNFDPWED